MAWWKVWESNRGDGEPKTVNIVLGYFFLVNYCIGTGFLGVPYSFFYSGYLASIPTLMFTAFFAWVTARWLIEIMARAQAVESYNQNKMSISNGGGYNGAVISVGQYSSPDYEISKYRKFEIVELSQIFVGKWFKYAYLFLFTFYSLLGNWSYASVAGSAWSSNIPYNFGKLSVCDDSAFHHNILPPNESCLYSYYFSLFLFGVIVTFLSILDLKEQVIVQVILGSARFFTIFAIIIYSLVKLSNANGGDVCTPSDYANQSNTSFIGEVNASRYFSYEDIVVKFDPKGWIVSVPVFLFAFMLHSGISSLTHPVKQKKYIHWMVTGMFVTALMSFMTLGIIVPLWFKASVQETVTLNWVNFTHAENTPQLRALSYYLIFFPSLDVMSAYPLTVICIANNVYMAITGRDTSASAKWKYDWVLRLCLRFITAVLPLALAFGAANLVFILQYAGLLGFAICFLFPVVLQLRSIYICNKLFGQPDERPKGGVMVNVEKTPLLDSVQKKCIYRSYMTPYSSVIISHPIFVVLTGCFGFCFFVISFVSLFIGPEKLTCQYNP